MRAKSGALAKIAELLDEGEYGPVLNKIMSLYDWAEKNRFNPHAKRATRDAGIRYQCGVARRGLGQIKDALHEFELSAAERDDFRHLPGGVFNKGFVRAYAQFIGIDPETMVTAYLEEDGRQQSRAARANGAPAHVHEPEPPAKPNAGRLWFAALVIVLILVLFVAGLTALGYGPLASRFKTLRSSEGPAAAARARGLA